MDTADLLDNLAFLFSERWRCKSHRGPGQYPLSPEQRSILVSGDLTNLRPDAIMWAGINELEAERERLRIQHAKDNLSLGVRKIS